MAYMKLHRSKVTGPELLTDDSTTCRVSHEEIAALRSVYHSELWLLQ